MNPESFPLRGIAMAVAVIATLAIPRADACKGTPRTPCSKSVVLNVISPGTVIAAPAGGSVPVRLNVFIGNSFFAPVGQCPVPTLITYTASLNCGGTVENSVTGTSAPTAAFSDIPITLLAAPGAPRLCTINATVRVTFNDGMVLEDSITTRSDVGGPVPVVCITDEVSGMPGKPALEIRLVDSVTLAPVDSFIPIHPGSQARYSYCLTNNTANDFRGTLRVGARNNSNVASDVTPSGVPNPGNDIPFTPADPVGDTIPILFADNLPAGLPCVPLPTDPRKSVPYVITKKVVIPAGQTIYCPMIARPWGLCASGTCTESVTVLEGDYRNPATGGFSGRSLGCAPSVVLAVNDATPPLLDCPEIGQVGWVVNANWPEVVFDAGTFTIGALLNHTQPIRPGRPITASPSLIPATDQSAVRHQIQLGNGGQPFQPGETIQISLQQEFFDAAFNPISLTGQKIMDGTPNGFSSVAPVVMGELRLSGSRADLATQLFARGQTASGQVWLPIQVTLLPGAQVQVALAIPTNVTPLIGAIQLYQDLRLASGPDHGTAPSAAPRTYEGVSLSRLGNALLDTSADCLNLRNLGSSGQDGVCIALPNPGTGTFATLPDSGPWTVGSSFDITYNIDFAVQSGLVLDRFDYEDRAKLCVIANQISSSLEPNLMVQFKVNGEVRGMRTMTPGLLGALTSPDGIQQPRLTGFGTAREGPFVANTYRFNGQLLFTSVQAPYQLNFADEIVIIRPSNDGDVAVRSIDLRLGNPPGGQFQIDSFFDVFAEIDLQRPGTPIGNASVAEARLLESGQPRVTVFDFEDEGRNGVRLDLRPDSDGFVHLEPLDLFGNAGGTLEFSSFGYSDGIPGRGLGKASFRDLRTGQIAVGTDFSALGAGIGTLIQVHNASGVLVGAIQTGTGPDIARLRAIPGIGEPRLVSFGKPIGSTLPCYRKRFDRDFRLSVGNNFLVGRDLSLLVDGPTAGAERVQRFEVTGSDIMPLEIVALSRQSAPPVVASIQPTTGQPGDIVTITGQNFGTEPDNLCLVLMPAGSNQVVPLEVLGATDTQIRARILQVPPELIGVPSQVMVARGNGNRGRPVPAFRDVIIEEPIWVWERADGDVENDQQDDPEQQNPVPIPVFIPQATPAVPNTVWLTGGVVNGRMCLELADPANPTQPFNWPLPSCIEISARLWDHTPGKIKGYDQYVKKVRFTEGNGTVFDCAARLCDVIRCAFFQQSGFWVECTVEDTDNDGIPEIYLTYQDGQVNWGNFQICITPETQPTITGIEPQPTPADPLEPGDFVVITGTGFPADPKDLCVVAMNGPTGPVVPFDVMGATPTRIIACVGAVPDNFTVGDIKLETGNGVCENFIPVFPDMVSDEPGWVWEPNGVPNAGPPVANVPFRGDPTNPDPLKKRYDNYFVAGTPQQMCVEIPEADWENCFKDKPECCIRINARLRGPNFEGYDAFTAKVRITATGLTFEQWLARLCDAVRCQFLQSGGFDTVCTATVNAGIGRLCFGFAPGSGPNGSTLNVVWGTLAVCIECPPPTPVTPVVTSIQPPTIRPGTVIEVVGTNFGNNPDDICAVGMIGDRTIAIDVIEAQPGLIRGVVGPLPPGIAGRPVLPGFAIGDGNRGPVLPLFADVFIPKPVWAWKTIPGAGDATGPTLVPAPVAPNPNQVWYHSEIPEDGKMCIYLPDAWPANGWVEISGRMRDHTTGKGYDQFASQVRITGGGTSPLDCAMRICDTLKCAWSQLAGVQVDCIAEPFGVEAAKITLSFVNGSIDWGHITVCVTDLAGVTRYGDWKTTNGVAADNEDADNDGNQAAIEFLIGGNPNVGDTGRLNQKLEIIGNEDVLTFDADPDIVGLRIVVECSENLLNWIPVAMNPVINSSGKFEVRWPRTPDAKKRFYCVSATAD